MQSEAISGPAADTRTLPGQPIANEVGGRLDMTEMAT